MPSKKTPKKTEDHAFTLIPREKLLALYAGLIRCRMIEEADSTAARRPNPRARGDEAPAVAVAIDLLPADTLLAPPRHPLPAFIKTGKLDPAPAAPAAKGNSPAAQLKAALAAARLHQQEQKKNIVAVFAAEAWTTSAAWRSAIEAAVAERLPILFVAPGPTNVAPTGKRRIPSIPVDRDDVVALYRVASESIAHARHGNGATVIECIPWQSPHTKPTATADPADAIANMERYLAHVGIDAGPFKTRTQSSFKRKMGGLSPTRAQRSATRRKSR